ncbi:unnamed protein product, partial [Rotaria sp. Silwood2]
QMKNKNKVKVEPSLRPKLPTKVNIIDKEIKEEFSNDSGIVIDQHQSSSSKIRSFSPSSNQVTINFNDQNLTNTHTHKQRNRKRHIRKHQRKQLIYEKELINKSQSSLLFSQQQKPHNLLSEQNEHKQQNLQHLFDEYSNETILKEWKPLTFEQSNEIYKYAFDKYYQKHY